MANHIPLQESVNAAGGYLVPPEQGKLLEKGIFQRSGVLAQALAAGSVTTTTSNQVTHVVHTGRPVAYMVDEDGAIPTTGTELGISHIDVKDIATITRATAQQIADCKTWEALFALVSRGVENAIADLADKHFLGLDNGADLTSGFNFALTDAVGAPIELGTTGDKERLAVSQAIASIQNSGYNPTGVIWTPDVLANVRDARQTVETTAAVYQGDNPFYGLNVTTSTNLNGFGAAAGKVVGVVGDFAELQVIVRQGIELAASTDGVIGGVSLFERKGTGYRWSQRLGAGAANQDAFRVITIPN